MIAIFLPFAADTATTCALQPSLTDYAYHVPNARLVMPLFAMTVCSEIIGLFVLAIIFFRSIVVKSVCR